MSPAGLHNGIVDALIKASPDVLFLAFGRRSILSSTTMWQAILYPPIFVRLIDTSLSFLFNWTSKNITLHQKLAAYPHLFSFTSTKSVVHWFQIIRNKTFQMYDDDVQAPLSIGAGERYYKVAKFPTRNIKTPIVLVYGGSDSLVDISVMLRELPKHTVAKEIRHFEHLDFLWAQNIETLVFPHVFEALAVYAGRDHFKHTYLTAKTTDRRRVAGTNLDFSGNESSSSFLGDTSDLDMPSDTTPLQSHVTAHQESVHNTPSTRFQDHLEPHAIPLKSPFASDLIRHRDEADSKSSREKRSPGFKNTERKRSDSMSSARSLESSTRFGEGGISVGAGKATIGGVSRSNLARSNEQESSKGQKK